MKTLRWLVASAILLGLAFGALAQVSSPKRESRLRHLFASHRDANNLVERYTQTSCALVVIRSGNNIGTGFYASADGDVITAAHVLGGKTFEPQGDGTMRITIHMPEILLIRDIKEEFSISAATLENNADSWSVDLALLKTRRKPTCWLKTGDDRRAKPGQHVVVMGFPGLAFGSLSMYSGMISARLQSSLIIGRTLQGLPLRATNDLLRVQMP